MLLVILSYLFLGDVLAVARFSKLALKDPSVNGIPSLAAKQLFRPFSNPLLEVFPDGHCDKELCQL
jgi:hypothetical protein